MRGLVTVGVLTDQAGNVGRSIGRQDGGLLEELVELGQELLLSAHDLDQAGGIVLDGEGRLPGVGLGEVAPARRVAHLDGIEGRGPLAVGEFGAREVDRTIVEVAVVARALDEHGGIVGVAKLAGDVGDGPVVVTVFEGLADRLAFEVAGDVALGAVVAEALEVVDHGALHHHLVGALGGDTGDALVDGLGDDGGGVIAGHGAGLAALEGPDGHACGALLGHADEGVGEVGDALRGDEGVERMGGAVGVPEREGGVVALARLELVDLLVHAAVAAVGVVEERGADGGVVERGVEDALVGLVGGLDPDARELLVPLVAGAAADALEVPVG